MANARTKRQCISCGGTYFPTGTDGAPYYHVCPELIVDDPGEVDPKTGKILRPHTYKPTPNPRNENEVLNLDPRAARVIISEGLGYREIP
jgi:hypothetical protein